MMFYPLSGVELSQSLSDIILNFYEIKTFTQVQQNLYSYEHWSKSEHWKQHVFQAISFNQ